MDAREWLDKLDARELGRAVEEVQRTLIDRVFVAMVGGEEVDEELLTGELVLAWLRDRIR
jgi:hypothetical protein